MGHLRSKNEIIQSDRSQRVNKLRSQYPFLSSEAMWSKRGNSRILQQGSTRTTKHLAVVVYILPTLSWSLRRSKNVVAEQPSITKNKPKWIKSGGAAVSPTLAVRRLIRGIKNRKLSVIIIFSDLKQGVGTIHRGDLIAILCAFGVTGK